MSKTTGKPTPEENLEARAELFKALGHPVRLLILNLVQMKPRHGEELATILRLKPATISHHLTKLTDVGLLTSKKDQYYQTFSLVGGMLAKTLGEVVRLPQNGLNTQVEEDAYRKKVLKTFLLRGRIKQMPVQLKKRQIILEKILEEFEPEREYPEREVNQILLEFHEDVATLRRELITFGFMEREKGLSRRVVKDPAD